MKGVSVHQPWATLIAQGTKRWETRTKPAARSAVGQRVFIAAAATSKTMVELRRTRPGMDALAQAGPHRGQGLPFGAIVGTARLVRSVPIVALYELPYLECACIARNPHGRLTLFSDLRNADEAYTTDLHDQLHLGHWEPGGWAWELADARPLPEPIPVVGRQGWWTYDLAEPELVSE